MAYICHKDHNCKACEHYRYDEDYGDMACFAELDLEKDDSSTTISMGLRCDIDLIESKKTILNKQISDYCQYMTDVLNRLLHELDLDDTVQAMAESKKTIGKLVTETDINDIYRTVTPVKLKFRKLKKDGTPTLVNSYVQGLYFPNWWKDIDGFANHLRQNFKKV